MFETMRTGAAREQTLRFGVFEVELRSGELRKAGIRVKLQEQPFKVLASLLERPGQLVTREDLRKRIWPGESFGDFDHAVNIAVAKIRTALSDSAETPHFIETLHGRGYRFIFPMAESNVDSVNERDHGGHSGAKALHHNHIRLTSISSRVRWVGIILLFAVATGGTLAWFNRPLPPPRLISPIQVTHDSFDKLAVLNDGSRLYVLESTGSKQFLVQVSTAGGETLVIPSPFTNIAISDISPDHSKLLVAEAIGRDGEGPLWVLPLPTGPPHRLGNIVSRWNVWSPGWAVWSPNGRRIAFAKGSEIYMANADGSDPRRLTTLPGYAGELSFSPDGTCLRFTLWPPQHDLSSIWEVHSDGSDLRPILLGRNSSASEIAGAWSADGRYYFFTRCDSSVCSVWAMHEFRGLFRHRNLSLAQLTASPTPVFLNGISPNGRKLFAGGWSSQSELVRYDSASRQFIPFLGGLSATQLDFSRDGNWVTYVAEPGSSLWRSRIDGSERIQLTSPPVSVLLPRWSPDGTQIAFVDEHGGPFWNIFLISAQGGLPEAMLPQKQNQMDPSWSPDGKQLAFGGVPWRLSNQDRIAIQILDLTSHRVRAIHESENLFAPRWSPDGRHLAAVSIDNKKLMLFDFRSQKWTTWVNESGAVGYPTWSRNGRYLYYDNTSVDKPGYHRVQIGQSRSEFLIDLTALHRPISSEMGPWANIAPDGSGLFDRDLSTSQVYSYDLEMP